MKLHIDVDQLKELSMEQVCKLNTLLNHEWSLTEEEFKKYNWNKVLKDTAEYCTIGRMIEILKPYMLEITQPNGIYCPFQVKILTNNFETRRVFYEKELCNTLWKAVKEIL